MVPMMTGMKNITREDSTSSYRILNLPRFLSRCPYWYQNFIDEMVKGQDDLHIKLALYDAQIQKSVISNNFRLSFSSADGYTRFCMEYM